MYLGNGNVDKVTINKVLVFPVCDFTEIHNASLNKWSKFNCLFGMSSSTSVVVLGIPFSQNITGSPIF